MWLSTWTGCSPRLSNDSFKISEQGIARNINTITINLLLTQEIPYQLQNYQLKKCLLKLYQSKKVPAQEISTSEISTQEIMLKYQYKK